MLPNFFILGAPKCGTTSLAYWLSKHSDVFMCEPKEPQFFNTDFALQHRPKGLTEYENLFEAAGEIETVGEATTGYLVSQVAVKQILENIQSPKFIVCLRSPVDMVISLHAQRLKEGYESLRSVEDAWTACSGRRQGAGIPILVPDAKMLDYRMFCKLGEQVDRLLSQVPRDRVHFILLEQLGTDPQGEFSRACRFLGVNPLPLNDFSHRNKGAYPRWLVLSRFVRLIDRMKRVFGIAGGVGIGTGLGRMNNVRRIASITESFRRELVVYFDEDIELLMKLTGLRLEHWRKPADWD